MNRLDGLCILGDGVLHSFLQYVIIEEHVVLGRETRGICMEMKSGEELSFLFLT